MTLYLYKSGYSVLLVGAQPYVLIVQVLALFILEVICIDALDAVGERYAQAALVKVEDTLQCINKVHFV